MKRKSTLSAIGGYQPFLFAIGMYFVALFFSIFICSAIFYAVNPKKSIANAASPVNVTAEKSVAANQGQPVLLTVTK